MPTWDPARVLDRDDVRAEVARTVTGMPGRVGAGLEVELLPVIRAPRPSRLPLHGGDGLLARLSTSSSTSPLEDGAAGAGDEAGWWLPGGAARVSFEPGGQLEVSSAYRASVRAALVDTDRTTGELAAVLDEGGVTLAAVGLDPWRAGTAAQQLRRARYPAMDAYLATRGPAGRVMMRDTCALQLNLDIDTGAEAEARWQIAHLLAPVATATFACSPGVGGRERSRRSLAWQALDPTRTGFPPGLVADEGGAAEQVERAVLAADVLLVSDGPRAEPGRIGWTFGDWLRDGDSVHGRPTAEDLRVHLTTLFHEVRPCGHLELRSLDAVPARWRSSALALHAGALYEPVARDRIREVLEPHRPRLPELLRAAAVTGVSDPALCALAVEVWSFALAGAARLPDGMIAPATLRRAEEFLDRFTVRGRCPADELAELLAVAPTAALDWAAEPLPTHLEVSS